MWFEVVVQIYSSIDTASQTHNQFEEPLIGVWFASFPHVVQRCLSEVQPAHHHFDREVWSNVVEVYSLKSYYEMNVMLILSLNIVS